MDGVLREILVPEHLVNTEVWDQPWFPGEAVSTTTLTEHEGQTTYTLTMQYVSDQARDAVVRSNMESGLEASYTRFDRLLSSLPTVDCASQRARPSIQPMRDHR